MHYHCWFVLNPVLSSCSNLFYFWPQWIAYAEKAMAPHSNILDWKIPWTEEPGGLQSMGLRRVGHDWVTSLSLFSFMHWKRKWQPTPVFLPGESQGQGSLVGCRLWGRRVRHDWSDLAAADCSLQAPSSVGFSRQEYWSGCRFLLQGIFLTQGLNTGLPHCRLYPLSHQGSPWLSQTQTIL